MINGRPIFPGSSTMNQIERVIEVIGMPSRQDIEAIASPFAATMLNSLPGMFLSRMIDILPSLMHYYCPAMSYKTLTQAFPAATDEALNLIQATFYFNPDKRPSAETLLEHPYVTDFHNPMEEPIFPHGALHLPVDDNTKLTAAQYRLLYIRNSLPTFSHCYHGSQ
jgi:mitogen-activated protein kinase 15